MEKKKKVEYLTPMAYRLQIIKEQLPEEYDKLMKLMHNPSGSDILILLERKFPTVYEIHRKEIRRAENLVLTTTDKEFAERLVNAYNHYR
jgi:hypothetical protein